MAKEYKLSFTAFEIDRRLGKIDELSTDVVNLDKTTATMQAQINNKAESSTLNNYYTKIETDSLELISIEDIDAICNQSSSINE